VSCRGGVFTFALLQAANAMNRFQAIAVAVVSVSKVE